jgi:hypothetical protein
LFYALCFYIILLLFRHALCELPQSPNKSSDSYIEEDVDSSDSQGSKESVDFEENFGYVTPQRQESPHPNPTPGIVEEGKTGKKWTPRKEKMLCLLWEDEDHLYNACHVDYRNPAKRKGAMDRIAAALNMEGI